MQINNGNVKKWGFRFAFFKINALYMRIMESRQPGNNADLAMVRLVR